MDVWLIARFSGDSGFLSNYSNDSVKLSSRLHDQPIVYPTAEHAFNALKTTDIDDRRRIARFETPGEAKRYGRRQISLRPEWDTKWRYISMEMVLRNKFFQGREITEKLRLTEPATLVEGNTWHDNHWGDCTCNKERCYEAGTNALGKMLMRLRSELNGMTFENGSLWPL